MTLGIVLRLRLIGQMGVWTAGGQSVVPTGRKTRALLAIVALSAPRPALRGRLAEMLWSRRPEEQARASLRQELHRLLEVLTTAGTDVLQVTRDHVALHPGAVWLDVDQVLRATPDNPAALALLEGDLLEDLDGLDPTFDAWLATERERLRDRGRELAEQLLREQDDPDALIPAAQRLLQIDRAHEGAWRALMRAHAARGERGMAIQAYDRCRAVLADMLDAAPSQETQKLLGEIRGPSSSRLPPRPIAADPGIGHPAILAEPRRGGGAHVGVLPFQLVSAEGTEVHLASGLTDEIAGALSRLRWLSVVASGSLARFAGQARDETEIRTLFGLDYVLDGTVQLARDRLRVSARLLDLRANGQVVWARRFDRQSADPLAAQDEIASELVAQIDPEIMLIEARHSAARPVADCGPYDLVLRAIPLMHRMEWEPFMQAGACLRQAMETDPDYAPAAAWRAYWHVFLLGQGWDEQAGAAVAQAGQLAQQAIRLDPMNARAMTIAGHVRAVLGRELLDALPLHERALALNPNLAMAWALSAVAHAYAGDIEEAERRIGRYKQLSPIDPCAFIYDGFLAIIQLLNRDFEAVVMAGRAVTQMNAGMRAGYKPYLAALGHLGRRQEAAIVLRRLLALEPDFSIRKFLEAAPFAREGHRDLYAQGLRLAGVSEGAVRIGRATVPARVDVG